MRKMMKGLVRRLRPTRDLRTALERVREDLLDGTIPQERFRMDWSASRDFSGGGEAFGHWCGTACCIAGQLQLRGEAQLVEGLALDAVGEVASWTGIEDHRLLQLFVPNYHRGDVHSRCALYTHNRRAAAEAIQNYLTKPEGHPWDGVDLGQ